jgi:hypothetical protein
MRIPPHPMPRLARLQVHFHSVKYLLNVEFDGT